MKPIQALSRGLALSLAIVPAVARAHGGHGGDAARSKVNAATRDPSSTSPVALPGAALVFEASGQNKRGTGRIGIEWRDFGFEAKLSAPLGDEGATDLANLSGLARKTTADVGATYLVWRPRADVAARAEACRSFVPEWVARKKSDFRCDRDRLPADGGFKKRYKEADDLGDDAGKERVCAEYLAALDAAAARAMSNEGRPRESYPPGFVCAANELDGEPLRRFDAATDVGTPVVLSLRVKASRDRFQFVDATTFVEQPAQTEISFSITGSAGVYASGLGYVALIGRYERSHEGKSPGEICSPLGTMGTLQCKQLAIGAPAESERVVGTLEWRRFLGPHFGVGPRVSYDFLNRALGMELPIYFLAGESGLSGGIELEFARDDDESEGQLTVFVGRTFEVL